MQTGELDYDLPEGLIATAPAEPRDAARLMVIDRASGQIDHHHVRDLPEVLGRILRSRPLVPCVDSRSGKRIDHCAGSEKVQNAVAEAVPGSGAGGRARSSDRGGTLVLPGVGALPETVSEVGTDLRGSGGRLPGAGGGLMVLNRSKVVAAAFEAIRVNTGGRVGGLYLSSTSSPEGTIWQVMLESRGTLGPGERLKLNDGSELELLASLGSGIWSAQLISESGTLDVLGRVGRPPLPPYIRRARRARGQPESQGFDPDRYNTVYAQDPGSVAAPTAGLHLTPSVLERLQASGIRLAWVTLHVGLGTFAPIRTERLEDHAIHSERIFIPRETIQALVETRRSSGQIIPVGTTSVRALESLPDSLLDDPRDYEADTNLFITPSGSERSRSGPEQSHGPGSGFSFRFTDALMTNFHLPRSSLLALVAALPGVGVERLLEWYGRAIDQRYRFYSYGDAMVIV